jgi:quercetin dioxygenase-like cupin family protein
MSTPRRITVLAVAATLTGTLTFRHPSTSEAQQPAARPLAFEQPLPEMDGKKLIMKVVDIRVAPGASSAPHKHGCAVVVYVISGAMRMQVRGAADSVYRAGQTFFERPTDIHQVSANASATDSAHFTATFVCDHVGPLTTPAP